MQNIDYSQIYGKLRRVYENYNVSTYKFRKNYANPFYKRLIDYLASVVPIELTRRHYDQLVPMLENLPPSVFNSLCVMEQNRQLDGLVDLIKIAAKG